jgi:hypothetical protein
MARKLKSDRVLFIATIALVGLGVVMVYSASAVVMMERYQRPYLFLTKQAMWAALGVAMLCVIMRFDYHHYRQPFVVWTCLGLVAFGLFAVLFSTPVGGARRWFALGGLGIQPSELAKLSAIFFIAAMLERRGGTGIPPRVGEASLGSAISRQLSYRLLGAARWAQGLLEGLGEGEKLGVGPVQVDLLAEGLADLVGGRVVELDAVVLGVEEVDAARDPVGDRALDPQARVLEAVIEPAHVVQALHLEGDLLHVVRLLPRLSGLGERQLVVLGVGLRAQEADTPLEVLVGDREAQDARVEVPHLPEVVAVESDVTQSADLWHGSLRSQVCL